MNSVVHVASWFGPWIIKWVAGRRGDRWFPKPLILTVSEAAPGTGDGSRTTPAATVRYLWRIFLILLYCATRCSRELEKLQGQHFRRCHRPWEKKLFLRSSCVKLIIKKNSLKSYYYVVRTIQSLLITHKYSAAGCLGISTQILWPEYKGQ